MKSTYNLEKQKEIIETEVGELIHNLYPTTFENGSIIYWSLGARLLRNKSKLYELMDIHSRIERQIKEIENDI